ncbi:hypothetical protein R2601_03228 [Salipiger bermudensis HTCC2601]|uniref:Uncharacterized protein n=1 Tax=Salipiger bermudensis (strain DSM 26914 / JCM 13377 / KCTC 12554 / HTCC2601) TaxID=314265 RepID=Q0FWK0_SALBH|nr:hypothetical protein R2601_03228 [Salipiger bermudensis HTCC2601]
MPSPPAFSTDFAMPTAISVP